MTVVESPDARFSRRRGTFTDVIVLDEKSGDLRLEKVETIVLADVQVAAHRARRVE